MNAVDDGPSGTRRVDERVHFQRTYVVHCWIEHPRRTEFCGVVTSRCVDVTDDHLGGTESTGHLGGDDADRTCAGDEHAGSGGDSGLLRRRDTDRQRLEQCCGFVGDRVGDVVGEHRLDQYVLCQRAVDRRRGEEFHGRAQVVAAGARLGAGRIGTLRFDGHPLPDAGVGHIGADRDDHTGRLVTEDQRAVDHVLADASLPVVMRIGPAHADGGDLDQYLVVGWGRHRPVFHSYLVHAGEHAGLHGLWHGPLDARGCCVDHTLMLA